MKLILKTLKQVPHEVEIESDEFTIKQLKDATEKKHGIEADTIKLVFNGIVLKDENSIKSYNITEGNVIVMMVSKTKVQNKPKVEEVPSKTENPIPNIPNTQGTKDNITTQSTTTTNNNNTTTTTTDKQPTTSTTGTVNSGQGTQNQPKSYTNEIKDLVEMGFPQDYADTAIRAARGNVSLAIEFLYNGIPENLPPETTTTTTTTTTTNNQPNTTQGTGQGQQPTSSLEAVRRMGSIIKVLCSNNPSALQNIILTLQQTRPELIELIKLHEEEFKNILQSPVTEEDLTNFQQYNNTMDFGQEGEGGQHQHQHQESQGQGQGGSSRVGRQGGQDVIRLSKDEFDAIQKLKEFGFSEMDAAQAYFACDKNVDMALNFLFEMKTQEGGSFDSKF